ncbi:heavy metal translocating P-type ATPase [Rhodopseudomonas rhenobacensis]|uniref:P-type Zn(2+) transporter n=1 Tax=Rhodopseudomonas rhenobacensis TaxID=87461 RepID=A0A7W7Z376_9BRAD|nr:heavy metal translocating P-type ATPase [Rhodopseudomonas rhenobacensis]
MPSRSNAAQRQFVVVHELPRRLRLRTSAHALNGGGGQLAADLGALPGVRSVRINSRARCAVVSYDGRAATRAQILDGLTSWRPRDTAAPPADHDDDEAPSGGRLALAALAALGAIVLPTPLRLMLTLASTAPTLAKGGWTLATRGVKVQVLDAVSIGVAVLRREYFTASAAQFLIELSEYIEASTGRRSDELIRNLLRPNPASAMVERDGVVTAIPFAELLAGDRVHVNAGELVPADGTVADGGATVNQSSVTGESLPIPKEAGDPLLSGTVLEEGRLVFIAERVGDATTTARISHFIREALGRRGTTQRLAETLADRRVWISLGSGAAVYALTRDARRLESMFLVDYSCAIKLGSAVTVKAALYGCARRGILVKGGGALETLADIDTMVFDKTGTLSHGELEVTDTLTYDPQLWPRARFLATIASVEEHSTHPVAKAVVRLARAEAMVHIGHEEVDFFIGHGLSTRIDDGLLRIGSRHYLVDHEQVQLAPYDAALAALEQDGKTLLHVALDGKPLGVIALRDRPREEAAATLRKLRGLGIRRLVMVTGDQRQAALRVAAGLDLDEVIYEADPERKASVLRDLKQDGHRVAFVGDGVNDGPALMTADIGIAMPQAADIARASADVVLLDDRLDGLPDAVAAARSAVTRIQRGFKTAIGVNTAIMAGASFGWLPPVLSSLLHNGTTIGILLDAITAADVGTQSSKKAEVPR